MCTDMMRMTSNRLVDTLLPRFSLHTFCDTMITSFGRPRVLIVILYSRICQFLTSWRVFRDRMPFINGTMFLSFCWNQGNNPLSPFPQCTESLSDTFLNATSKPSPLLQFAELSVPSPMRQGCIRS